MQGLLSIGLCASTYIGLMSTEPALAIVHDKLVIKHVMWNLCMNFPLQPYSNIHGLIVNAVNHKKVPGLEREP